MKLLLYCCKAKPYLVKCGINTEQTTNNTQSKYATFNFNVSKNLNGKIVAECDFEVENIEYDWYPCDIVPKWDHYFTYYRTNKIEPKEFYEKSCLNWEQLNNYLNDYDSQSFEGGYAIHIKNLHIFDEPKKLSEYYTRITDKDRMNDYKGIDVIFPEVKIREHLFECVSCKKLEKAPQNMQKIVLLNKETNEYEYAILISIRPEWLCKILNKEKTIEVRKKVLKEMLNNE